MRDFLSFFLPFLLCVSLLLIADCAVLSSAACCGSLAAGSDSNYFRSHHLRERERERNDETISLHSLPFYSYIILEGIHQLDSTPLHGTVRKILYLTVRKKKNVERCCCFSIGGEGGEWRRRILAAGCDELLNYSDDL